MLISREQLSASPQERVLNIILLTTDHPAFYQEITGPKIVYNVWESTLQPVNFFGKLREFDQMWVPSRWQRDCTIDQGYSADKIFVVPEGVDGDYFKPGGVQATQTPFNFLMLGKWYARKSPKEIIEAFLVEFEGEDVRLSVNIDTPPHWVNDGCTTTKERLAKYGLLSGQINIIDFESKAQYLKRLQEAHVYLSCAKAEGWNLPLIEAMACGVPSICSDYGAQLDFADGVAHKVKVKGLKPMAYYYDQPGGLGMEADIDFEDLRAVMRDTVTHFAEYKAKALNDSEEVRTKWSWENTAKRAVEVLSGFKRVDAGLAPAPTRMEVDSSFAVMGDSGEEVIIDFKKTSIEDANKIAFLFGYGYRENFENNIYERGGFSIKEGDIVVDIGAHVGLFSRYAASRGAGKVFSFEADVLNFSCLLKNAPENCLAFNFAITNKIGFCDLFLDQCTGGHSLYNSDINKTKTGKTRKVQCVTLDSLFEKGLFDCVDFLKIDVEGAEREILTGLSDAVLGKIKKIAVEYHHMILDFDKSHEEIIKKLSATHNFKMVKLGEQMSMLYFLRKDLVVEEPAVFKPIKDRVLISFYGGARVEILGKSDTEYRVEFIDGDTGVSIFGANHMTNHWLSPNIKYYMNWLVRVTRKDTRELVAEERFDPRGKKVAIHLDSRSMGDILAWIPYAEEFRKKHDCEVFLDTFNNALFAGCYPNIKFVEPPGPSPEGIYARFSIGVRDDNADHNRNNWRTVPLQKVATDYLGLDYVEVRPEIKKTTPAKGLPTPYVTIAEHSTMMNKYWLFPGGWQTVVDFLADWGYYVVAVSREDSSLERIVHRTGRPIEETMANIAGAAMHIGTSAGPSWLAWALGVKTMVIAGSSQRWEEMRDCIRIINENVCHGCGNDPKHFYDRGNRLWCPRDKKFECSRSILPETVIDELKKALPKQASKAVTLEQPIKIEMDGKEPPIKPKYRTITPPGKPGLSRLNIPKILELLPKDPIIVEIGMARDKNGAIGDGHSTIEFAKFMENGAAGGLFYSVDVDPNAIKVTKDLFKERGIKGSRTMLVLSEGIDFFRNMRGSMLSGTIDLLYLDAVDWTPDNSNSQLWHLECFKTAAQHLANNVLVLIDDVGDLETFRGKGEYLIPYMLKNGYRIVEGGYQVLLQKTG